MLVLFYLKLKYTKMGDPCEVFYLFFVSHKKNSNINVIMVYC